MTNQMYNPFDPMLNADPFGLTTSMHFLRNLARSTPTQSRLTHPLLCTDQHDFAQPFEIASSSA